MSLETSFLEKLGDQWQGATPGFCLQAYEKGKKVADLEVGETFPYYDLASLTKPMFTNTALMFQHDDDNYAVNDRVIRWIEWFPEDSKVRIRDLLTHSAGLTWWHPFYKEIAKKTDEKVTPERAWSVLLTILSKQVSQDYHARPFVSKTKSVYSDLDYLVLGNILESITGRTLTENWDDCRDRMGLVSTDFHRGNKPKGARSHYAPTEFDKSWRKKTLQGEVDDQNTWALKGVAPHAGLFGTIGDVSRYCLHLRSAILGKKSRAFPSPATTQLFTKRAIPRARGDWSLGFMMPTKGSASCGPKFSLSSVGHTGFTGTSLWYDPKQDLVISILSNRVHPTADNKRFAQLRPLLHTLIVNELGR